MRSFLPSYLPPLPIPTTHPIFVAWLPLPTPSPAPTTHLHAHTPTPHLPTLPHHPPPPALPALARLPHTPLTCTCHPLHRQKHFTHNFPTTHTPSPPQDRFGSVDWTGQVDGWTGGGLVGWLVWFAACITHRTGPFWCCCFRVHLLCLTLPPPYHPHTPYRLLHALQPHFLRAAHTPALPNLLHRRFQTHCLPAFTTIPTTTTFPTAIHTFPALHARTRLPDTPAAHFPLPHTRLCRTTTLLYPSHHWLVERGLFGVKRLIWALLRWLVR